MVCNICNIRFIALIAGSPRASKIVSLRGGGFLAVLDDPPQGTDKAFFQRRFGELAAYARFLRELGNRDKRNPSLFEPEDLEQKG